ncbi:MAG: RagB/SusD family nutrient uptake outer membrane protein [Bacteroidales bacterium]|nr:RagB/SusD family nutrient uptake outer membrane protein [Bacteroidales bacterium]
MKKLVLLLLACCTAFSSCDELLNEIIDNITQDEVNNEENVENEDDENPDPSIEERPIDKFKSEHEVTAAISSIYVSLCEYIENQNELEKLYLIDKNFAAITPKNTTNAKAWNAAYSTIVKANYCIRSLENSSELLEQEVIEKYIGITYALIGFTYKNMCEHWGNIPIITPYSSETEMLPTANEEEVRMYTNEALERSLNILEGYEISDSRYISHASTLLAAAEVKANHDYNQAYEFSKRFSELYQEDLVFELEATSGKIVIYTAKHAELFRGEFAYHLGRWEEEGITDIIILLDKWDPSSYGYWAMLKRNKKLSEVTGCPEHMQHLPIPQYELDRNYNIIQNPGY